MAYTSATQGPMPDEYMSGMDTNSFFSETQNPGLSSTISQSGTEFDISSDAMQTRKDQKVEMQSILDIFQLDEDLPDGKGGSELEANGDQSVDREDEKRRTERLRGICPALDRIWWTSSEYIIEAAERLADGSRDPRWRIPMGESGILDSFLPILATEGVQEPLMVHVLRLVGNSCADTDENRERVVSQGYLPSLIALLKHTSLLPFVIPVIFNICVDYEPAQQQASQAHLTKQLIDLIQTPSFIERQAFLGYICKLLDLLIKQPSEVDLAPEGVPTVLLDRAFDPDWNVDLEDYLALTNSAIAYLRHERFQKAVINYSALQSCLRIMVFSYTRFEDTAAHMFPPGTSAPDQDDAKQLAIMRSNMNQVLSDISALPEFAVAFPVMSPFCSSLRRLLSSPQLQLQVMACIVLGNLARSDAACEEFVHTCQIHKPLISILSDANDHELLHSALGFLKNLALPIKNKPTLGEAGLITILPRLWALDALPQIQYSSISLARQLLNNTFENVRRLCWHLSPDRDSPAYSRTNLSILIDLFQRTNTLPVKMEIARLLTAVVRVFTSPSQNIRDVDRRRAQFFEYHPDVGRPLSFMVSQKKWPVVRSEGWFVMALMARTPEGALCVSDIMHDMQVFQPLVELLTGKSIVDGTPTTTTSSSPPPGAASESPLIAGAAEQAGGSRIEDGTPMPGIASSKEQDMLRIDRENALVLVSELLRHRGSSMAAMRRAMFEDLLKGGALVHSSYQQQVKEQEDFFDGKVDRPPRSGLSVGDISEESIAEIMG